VSLRMLSYAQFAGDRERVLGVIPRLPDQPDLVMTKADAVLAIGDLDQCEQLLAHAPDHAPGLDFMRAYLAFMRGDVAAAAAAARRIIAAGAHDGLAPWFVALSDPRADLAYARKMLEDPIPSIHNSAHFGEILVDAAQHRWQHAATAAAALLAQS